MNKKDIDQILKDERLYGFLEALDAIRDIGFVVDMAAIKGREEEFIVIKKEKFEKLEEMRNKRRRGTKKKA